MGVEVILGFAILNKAGGAYGILSIVTGHPLNFWQWFYNILCIMVLPFYISGIVNLKNRKNNGRKISLTCLLFIADTLFGFLYTLYFIYYWFSNEDNKPTDNPYSSDPKGQTQRVAEGSHTNESAISENLHELMYQSASPARELFLTISGTIILTVGRFYFTLIIISFTRELLKLERKQRYISRQDLLNGQITNTSITVKISSFIYNMETRAKEITREHFAS